ncbi:MAG: hypothetical protein M1837_003743 [Sclerophora amabilis]|nr:MAG: hypothetical protein M1837_003743 [Sclerophora amabilis]
MFPPSDHFAAQWGFWLGIFDHVQTYFGAVFALALWWCLGDRVRGRFCWLKPRSIRDGEVRKSLTDENGTLISDNRIKESLEEEIRTSKATNENHQALVAKWNSDEARLMEEIHSRAKKIETLSTRIEDLSKKNVDLESKLAVSLAGAEEIETLSTRIEDLSKKNADLELKLAVSSSGAKKIENLSSQVTDLSKKNADLQVELAVSSALSEEREKSLKQQMNGWYRERETLLLGITTAWERVPHPDDPRRL